MKSVIEFPRLKAPEDRVELAIPIISKKIFNIADWTPNRLVRLGNAEVDSWPFCAA
jgi:hypothetical protein